ncbi:MAG: chemotaxis protein CheX [Bryobacteraceae bacterium]
MPSIDTGAAMETAAREVLETMFFTEPLEEPLPAAGPRVCAAVRFEGGLAGRFSACAEVDAAKELAATFLGQDGEPSAEAVAEVMGELANMICGSVLARVAPEAALRIIPESRGPCPGTHAGGKLRALPLAGGTLELRLEM